MATIIQPYNSWREQAIIGLVAPIIGDWIKSSREAEQNRKHNALNAQVMQNFGLHQKQNTPLALHDLPEGYNSDGWQNAFHQSASPLELFDLGTAGIAHQQQALPSIADMAKVFAQNIDSERFGMLDPQKAWQLFAPYMHANEISRIEQRKSSLADTVMAAKDAQEKLNALYGGYIIGDVPIEGLQAGQELYKYDKPYLIPQNYNDGAKNNFWSFNPANGERSNLMTIQNSLSPRETADIDYRNLEGNRNDARYYAGLSSQERQNAANREVRRYEFDTSTQYNREGRVWEQGHKTRVQDEAERQAQHEREHPTLASFRAEDGSLFFANPRTGEIIQAKSHDGKNIKISNIGNNRMRIFQDTYGNYVLIDPVTGNTTPVIAQNGAILQGPLKQSTSGNRDLTDSQKLEYNGLLKEATELRKQKADYQKQAAPFADSPNDPIYKSAVENLQRIDNRLTEIERRQREILGDPSAKPNDNNQSNSVGLTPFTRNDEPPANVEAVIVQSNIESNDVKPNARKEGEEINIELPDSIWFDTVRDKDIPNERILTLEQFKSWVNSMLGDKNLMHLTPEQIIQYAVNNGFRIKRDNNQASLPPEVTGTTFMGEDLPELQPHWALGASLAPFELRKSNNERYPEGTPIETIRSDEGLAPIPNEYTQNSLRQNYNEFDNSTLPASQNSNGIIPRRNIRIRNARATAPRSTSRRPGQIIPNTSYQKLKYEVDNSARRYGIDPELIRAIIQIESRWDSNATGPKTRYGHAKGLMQLIDSTAKSLGVHDAYDPAQNIEGGSKYIAYLIKRYKGNLAKAIMAYNTGPGNVDKGRIPSVTRKYARDVMAIYNRLKYNRG